MKDFLSDIEIINFKKIRDLSVENLGRINLVTGDNNVGKTTFLESLLFSENNLEWIGFLHSTLCCRAIHFHPTNKYSSQVIFPEESFLEYLIDTTKPLEIQYSIDKKQNKISLQQIKHSDLTLQLQSLRNDKYDLVNLNHWVLFKKDNLSDELQWLYRDDYDMDFHGYWPFVSFNLAYSDDLKGFVSELEKKVSSLDLNFKRRIIDQMKLFIPDIQDYEVRKFGNKDLIGIATQSYPQFVPITQFGDGVQKYFRYLVEILYAKEKGFNRIMIDEIDTGIHYLKLPELWKSLMKISEETNIQIFATTHSYDCIQALVESVSGTEYKNEIRLIELELFENDKIFKHSAKTFQFDELKFRLESEMHLRGGQLWP